MWLPVRNTLRYRLQPHHKFSASIAAALARALWRFACFKNPSSTSVAITSGDAMRLQSQMILLKSAGVLHFVSELTPSDP